MTCRSHVVLLAVLLSLTVFNAAAQQTTSGYEFLEDAVGGEVDVRADIEVGDGWGTSDAARIVFCYADAANYQYLQMYAGGAALGKVADGRDTVLATHQGWPAPAEKGKYAITIKRRALSTRVLCDRKGLLRVYDLFRPGEQIGHVAQGAKVSDIYAQPIGEMLFDDDFARPAGEPNPWESAGGSWRTALPESRNARAEAAKSANPFSYVGMGAKALALAGETFWDGYEASTATKPRGRGYVGMAFYVAEPSDCYLFRVAATTSNTDLPDGKAELIKIVDGETVVLDDASRYLTSGNWYTLTVRAHDGWIAGLVDGRIVCEAQDETFGEGRIGLYTEGCSKAYFDDVQLAGYRQYRDEYDGDQKLPIHALAGTWTPYQGRICGKPAATSQLAIGITGSPDWSNYRFSADILPWTATSVGLTFALTDRDDYYLFLWGPSAKHGGRASQQLWKIADGQGSLIADRSAAMNPQTTYHVDVTADRNYIAVAVDGKRALQAVDTDRAAKGMVGYYVYGSPSATAAFDNIQLSFLPPPVEPVSITEQFAKEDTMADWARPLASWSALGSRVYAYTLPAWGDFDIRCQLKYFTGRNGSIGLRLAADTDGLKSADDALEFTAQKGVSHVKCSSGKSLSGAGGSAEPQEDEPLLEIERRGGIVIARLDGEPFGWVEAGQGTEAPAVGLKLGGVGINLDNVTLTSPNIVDESFSGAPTDWQPGDGLWEISDRWNCQPQWSWLCGRQAQTPLLWSKPEFGGDMVFEFWGAMMMDLSGGPGYSHPSDINGIICGDGENLCSGYAFVFAGDKNTCSKIIRRGETVAATTAFKFANPSTSGNLNDFHRHWFHCRLERTGNHLTFYVDGRKALEYDDPDPINSGRVGIWTHQRNGIIVARTRIAFSEKSQ